VIDAQRIAISLELGCSPRCDAISAPLLLQLRRGRYEKCSVLEIPETVIDWAQEHRTARKRAKRAGDRGYLWQPLARENYADEIHAINTSTPERQGRTMDAPNTERP